MPRFVIEIHNADHTMGNLLRHYLLKNHKVNFVSYRIPDLAVRTIALTLAVGGDTDPRGVVQQALKQAEQDLSGLLQCMH